MDMEKDNLIVLGIGAAFFTVFLGLIAISDSIKLPHEENDKSENTSEEIEYAEPGEDAGTVEEASNNVNVTVEISSAGVDPGRPRVDLGEKVMFVNSLDYPVRLEFDRTEEDPLIEPGESSTMSFTAMVSYDVVNVETDEIVTGGGINAQ